MATAPKTLGRHKGKRQENRGNAHQRGYTRKYRKTRLAFLQDRIAETGTLNCDICGKTMLNSAEQDITIDHIVPRSKSPHAEGTAEHSAWMRDTTNWRIAHRSCNSSRQDRG